MRTRFAPSWFVFALCLSEILIGPVAKSAPLAASVATVTVTASDPIADESGPSTGLFTVRRSGPTTNSLAVSYRATGTAVNGIDYVTLPETVTIPIGASSTNILVTPINDNLAEAVETVIVTLISPIQPLAASPLSYVVGHPNSATILIKDDDRGRVELATINIQATDPNAAEPSNPGTITVSRLGSISNALEVAYEVITDPMQTQTPIRGVNVSNSGPILLIPAATPGQDYQALPGKVTIAAGHTSAAITIQPIDDQLVEGQEHVTLKLKPSSLYNINQPDRATVIIADNDPVNQPPVVKIANPGNGQSFPALGNIPIQAAATDLGGRVLKVEFFANGKSLGITTNNPANQPSLNPFQFTWNKIPAGGYSLTAIATDDLGLTARSAAVQISVVEPVQGEALVSFGAGWKYLDDGSDQGTAWRTLAFNDSKWASGPAQLGYGDGDEATVVSFGPNPSHKYVTTYFRHTFTVPDASRFTNLEERILRDDGAVVYLNGTEISHGNLPGGTVTNGTLAVVELTGAAESQLHFAQVNPKLLVNGANIIAVEIHQASVASQDLSFDFELSGNVQTPATNAPSHATLVINSPKDGAAFNSPAVIPILATAVDPQGYISRVEFLANNQSIGVSQLEFFRAPDPGTPIQHNLDWTKVPAGKFILTATAKDTAGAVVTSAPVTVTVTTPINPTITTLPTAAGLLVSVQGETGRSYRIQTSSDLIHWTDLDPAGLHQGSVEVLDHAPSGHHRFYRAVPLD